MSKIKFYFDEHMPRAVAKALNEAGYETIMAVAVGMENKDDDTEHLPYARDQSAVVVTRDYPFAGRAAKHTNHAGLICWTGRDNDIGGMIRALSDFANAHTADDVQGRVFWIK